jgi:exodeoxyribonuclease-3
MSTLKIASWNVNSLRVRLEQVTDWLEQTQVDVLGLQELKLSDDEFPASEFQRLGYHCEFTGQKTYNGVALISKHPIEGVVREMPNYHDEQRRFIAGKVKGIQVVNVYVPNGQELGSEKFEYKQRWFQHLQATMSEYLSTEKQVVLMGDFNITPADIDVHDPKKWRGKIHCSDIERLMLHKLMSEGLYDSYRHLNSQGDAFSWWDYRGGGYRANEGLRIDLVLSSGSMLDSLTECHIDEQPRQRERPSDHTPVVAAYAV